MRGWSSEGLAIVKGVRGRHDGRRRNPWNEFECGSHYARSMASWSVLTALSGFGFGRHMLSFAPRLARDGRFACFWSVDGAWGLYQQQAGRVTLSVAYGQVRLQELGVPLSMVGLPAVSAAGRSALRLHRSLSRGDHLADL